MPVIRGAGAAPSLFSCRATRLRPQVLRPGECHRAANEDFVCCAYVEDKSDATNTVHPGSGAMCVATPAAMLMLPASSISPTAAREWARRAGCAEHAAELLDDALLLISELVTNAVLHGGPPIMLSVECDGDALHVRVRDGSTALPEPRGAEPDAEGGRGMTLVELLTDTWGSCLWRTLMASARKSGSSSDARHPEDPGDPVNRAASCREGRWSRGCRQAATVRPGILPMNFDIPDIPDIPYIPDVHAAPGARPSSRSWCSSAAISGEPLDLPDGKDHQAQGRSRSRSPLIARTRQSPFPHVGCPCRILRGRAPAGMGRAPCSG